MQPAPEPADWPGLAAARWSRPMPLVAPTWAGARRPFWVVLSAAATLLLLVGVRARQPVAVPLPPVVAKKSTLPTVAPSLALEAVVTLVGGRVTLTRAGQSLTVDGRSRLSGGDGIELAPAARLAAQWADGSGFLVTGPARMTVDRLTAARTSLGIERGQIDVRVRPGSGQAVAVVTPRHIVSVHGTWFRVAASLQRTTVEVLEGVVDVAERDGSSSTLLRAPARATFGVGSARTGTLTAGEATRLRAESELNLSSTSESTGLLHIDAPALANVAVDGVTFGQGSLAVRRPLGRHLVELTELGFTPARRWVDADQPLVTLSLALGPLRTQDISADDLARTLARQRPQIQSCYERGLKRDPQLTGTIVLRLEIGEGGRVRRASVESSTLNDAPVVDCLVDHALHSVYPGENVTVVYPLVLRPLK